MILFQWEVLESKSLYKSLFLVYPGGLKRGFLAPLMMIKHSQWLSLFQGKGLAMCLSFGSCLPSVIQRFFATHWKT